MESWPLERIPQLDLRAVTAIVQSIAQAELGQHNPLSFEARAPHEFASIRWEALGFDGSALENVAQRCNAMFNTTAPTPAVGGLCGDFAQQVLQQWENSDRLLTFFTSGSTGKPKPCTHKESHIRQEVTSLAPIVADRTSALVTVPMHHMYGFTFGLLLPLSLGVPIRSVPPLPTMVEAQMRPGDLVITIPLLLSRFVDMRGWQTATSEAGQGITLLTGTSPTPPEVMYALERQAFRVMEFFGSSEMGVVCCRFEPEADYELLPHVARGEGEHGNALVRCLPDGVVQHYPLMDNVTWTGQRHLRPGARIDKAVQVGGINVFPQYVASVIERHEGVKQCLVRLMRHEEGYRLKAFVVPEPNCDVPALHKALIQHARQELSDVQRPGAYTFGPDIPRGPLGKPMDW